MKAAGSSRSRSCRRGSASRRRSSSVAAALIFAARALIQLERSSLTGTRPPSDLGRSAAKSDSASVNVLAAGNSPGASTIASAS